MIFPEKITVKCSLKPAEAIFINNKHNNLITYNFIGSVYKDTEEQQHTGYDLQIIDLIFFSNI